MNDDCSEFLNIGVARVDVGRHGRCGFPEVIFGPGKRPEDMAAIAKTIVDRHGIVLATRVDEAQARAVCGAIADARWHERARCVTVERTPLPKLDGAVAVVCAGTSDLPVAEEAAVTLDIFGNRVERFCDVGVAGIHRLLAVRDKIEACNAVVVVAGMEGALPSAIAGLVSKPVVAVPTSVGYGASFGGVAALLGMLNSCGSGVTVVNIDNGFGAAYAAATINRLLHSAKNGG